MTATQFATLAIHGGNGPDPSTGAILTPIHQSTTYRLPGLGEDAGFTYSRAANPTVASLEAALAKLDAVGLDDARVATCGARAFATGMAAIVTLVEATCRQGDRIVCSRVCYGGVVRLARERLSRHGIEVDFVDTTDLSAVEEALQQPTRLVLLESPANPTLELTDIAAVAQLARAANAICAVDNTFLTPALCRPLELGADVAVYSTTKFVEGHNSTLGGALVAHDPALVEAFDRVRKTLGNGQSPLEAWLTLRGLSTLELRIRRHTENALTVGEALERHSAVSWVRHPDRPDHPQYALAQRQHAAGGGILCFELEGGIEAVRRFVPHLRTVSLAENLGATESLLTHSASMTHGDLSPDERSSLGIADGFLRLSVGLEDPQDVVRDLLSLWIRFPWRCARERYHSSQVR